MPDFKTDVVFKVAQVIGGTVSAADPNFFNGSPIAGLEGCHATPPDAITSTPVGVLYWNDADLELASQGEEDNEDHFILGVLIARYVAKTQEALLLPFRDSVPTAIRAHMQAFNIPSGLDVFPTHAAKALHVYGDVTYLAIDFTIRVRRMLAVTYTQ